ncbi:MAG: YdeI/OmpD-associated family protein [Bacteroidia bacterium]
MSPTFFSTPALFRKWLEKNHKKEKELLVGFYKVGSGIPSMTWPESVDEALCFGWIDGVRKSLGKESYTIRFTPRKPNSIWSTVNVKKMEALTKKGLMKPEGLAAFQHRKEHRSGIYTHELASIELSKEFEKIFRSNKKAWTFFSSQAPYYQKVIRKWIMTAKQEETRIKRLNKAIDLSEQGKRVVF